MKRRPTRHSLVPYATLFLSLLVAAAKRGDTAAFEELVNRYERKIFRLTMNITGNREDAEDAMQDAFLKSYTHLQSFQGDSRFYTWLVRIAANEALMRLRKRRPNQFSLDEPVEGEDDLMPREIEEWGPSPEQHYAQTEMEELERHLGHCEYCTLIVDQTKKTVEIFCDSEPVALPTDVHSRLHEALHRGMKEKPN